MKGAGSLLPGVTLLVALVGAASAPGCKSNDATTSSSGSPSGSSGGTTANPGDQPYTPQHTWTECQASDQAFVRRAILALDGRTAWGQAEVNAFEDAINGIRQADREAAGPFAQVGATLPPDGADLENARKIVAKSMMQEDAFRERWSDFLLEALHVNRIEVKDQEACYGPPDASAIDDGSLAAFVRDHDPAAGAGAPPIGGFNMGQLLSSALQLDDLSVIYRGNLFAMVNLPLTGANVDADAMERVRRQDFGAIFDSAYLHRDPVCLNCHNSEFSVTFNQDPALNRSWPVPGLFEESLYSASNGMHPASDDATKGPDDLRAWSMLRYVDVGGGGQQPWGWSSQCGSFSQPQSADPLAIDAYFGSIQSTPADPTKGLHASVWDVERALHRGVDRLAAHGLERLAGGHLADPDEAFAYLVAENIVEKVWTEAVGTPLTIANYFPRTQVQRDILMALTEHFVATHFSLQTLLLDILAHPAFNLRSPAEGCGVAPYELPNVFDPWSVAESDLGMRGNSPADGVFSISARPIVRSLHRAMGWPYVAEYPSDETFEVAVGFFIKDGEPGFRGLDFQGRLTWEQSYGVCQDLSGGTDFITQIVAQAQATPGATLGDGVVALKDRLLGEPSVDVGAERTDIEALLGASLASTDMSNLGQQLRTLCGVLVSTPQFMLGGLPPVDARYVPTLTPPGVGYDTTCSSLSQYVMATGAPYVVTCGGTTTVTHQ